MVGLTARAILSITRRAGACWRTAIILADAGSRPVACVVIGIVIVVVA